MIRLGDEESINFSAEFDIDTKAIEQLRHDQMDSMSQGEYNAYALKRDGYLSPENCWKPRATRADGGNFDDWTQADIGVLGEWVHEMARDYGMKHFTLPVKDMDIAGWVMDRHVEEFRNKYNKMPKIHINKKTLNFLVLNSLDLTKCPELSCEIDKDSGIVGTYESCDIVIDNELYDYEVTLE